MRAHARDGVDTTTTMMMETVTTIVNHSVVKINTNNIQQNINCNKHINSADIQAQPLSTITFPAGQGSDIVTVVTIQSSLQIQPKNHCTC